MSQNENTSYSLNDEQWMRRAMELAQRGGGAVHPNPLVGALLVRDGQLLAEGWHERWGGLHAERNALAHCPVDPAGATMYVTLEPCCHYGKTPPCTEALIAARVARVVVGLTDPNPLVAGKGIAQLRAAGIEVTTGVLAEELRWQNRIFLHYITHRRPWVVLKSAVTLDGKIATRTGDSRWVTGDEARRYVHRMRGNLAGIMVGIGTALADDPLLNCRLDTIGTPLSESLRQPTRWVVDSQARLPLASQLVQSARGQRTIIAHTAAAPAARLQALRDAGVETCLCDSDEAGHVAVPDLVRRIGEAGIDSLLLEGGGTLAEAFLRARCVQEVCCMIAPKLVGGRDAKTSVEGVGVARMADAITLHDLRVTTLGADLMVQALVDAQ